MDRIHYAGHSVVTGTAIAETLLDYAQALAQANASATVRIPTLNDDGSLGRSEVLVGPSSQLMSDSEESEHDDIVDDVLLTYLRQETAKVRAHGIPSAVAEFRVGGADGDWTEFDDVR